MTELEQPPSISDRVHAFLHPPQRPDAEAAGDDPDAAPRTINGHGFDDTVLILEALVDALQARLVDTVAKDATEAMVETLTKLIGDLTNAAGDVSRNARDWAAEEWKTDLRWVLAMGTDPRYKDR